MRDPEHMVDAPQARRGEIAGWPKLVITYPTESGRIADLLPPGLEPTGDDTCELAWSTAYDWAGRGGSAAANTIRAVANNGGRRALAQLRDIVESSPGRFDP